MLTGKQKHFLRGQAQIIKPLFHVGKGGLSDAFGIQVENALQKRELVKVNIMPNADVTVQELSDFMIKVDERINIAQVIGHTVVFYQPSMKRENQKLSKQVKALLK